MGKIFFFMPFIGIVILIYSLILFYYIRKTLLAFKFRQFSWKCYATLISGSFTPVFILVFLRNNTLIISSYLVIACYVWITYLFLFFSLHGTCELINLGFKKMLKYWIHEKTLWVAFQLICFSILIYGYFDAKNIRVEQVEILTNKLKEGESWRIVQFSDVHFSAVNGETLAKKIVEKVNAEKPNIIVSTGDLIDRGMHNPDTLCEILNQLTATHGIYAVTGNHEYYYGVEEAVTFHKRCGFELLQNDNSQINGINLVGINDKAVRRFSNQVLPSEKDLMEGLSGFKVYLKHQPQVSKDALKYFDLMLSGHTHAGQIFPFGIFVKLAFPYFKGLYKVDESYIYVSRGTGTWGPPIRFLSPPEVTVINVRGIYLPPEVSK